MKDKYNFVDLTHDLHGSVPTWDGTVDFSIDVVHDYPKCGYRIHQYSLTKAGVGTHLDAPAHFFSDGKSVADYNVDELITPACIIDVRESVKKDPDYQVSVADIMQWEKDFGDLPEFCTIIAYTGWQDFWGEPEKYLARGSDGVRHFPGFSAEVAAYLVNKKVNAVGIDTLSIDPGNSQTFQAHKILLRAGKFLLENLANLDKLPAAGAWLITAPLKVRFGTEAPARIIACLPKKYLQIT